MNPFKFIVESGVSKKDPLSTRRSVVFSNYIVLVLIAADAMLFFIIPENINMGGFLEAIFAATVFSAAIVLNRLGLITLSRLYLCWSPPILITWAMITGMESVTGGVPISAYGGLRIYVLATSCIPYLLFSPTNFRQFLLAVLPSMAILVFFDPILQFFDVGYFEKGVPDPGYRMIQVRSMIAYTVVGGSCLSLKFVVDRVDLLNQKLITELKIKNEIIQKQADSDLKQMNERLAQNVNELTKREIILKRSQEVSKVGSWEYNLIEDSVYWSDQMYEILGVERDFQIKNPSLDSFLTSDSASQMSVALKELITLNKPHDIVLRTREKKGVSKWVRVIGFPLSVNGKITALSGILHDITFYKQSEENIKANERKYRALFEQASDGIVITDLSGAFLDVNSSLCRIMGYEPHELKGKKVEDFIDADHYHEKPLLYDDVLNGVHLFIERVIRHKSGKKLYVEANVKKFSDSNMMAIIRDITERKQIESEKEHASWELNERVKELTVLYRCSQILQEDGYPLHRALQEIVEILPGGWQYPEDTAARISLSDFEFVTQNYREGVDKQQAFFTTRNELKGIVEVVYLIEKPRMAEGPFLNEERNLINMIADMIDIYISRHYESEALRRAEANQRATINNTNFFIWSVNPQHQIINFNKPFEDFIGQRFGVVVRAGERLSDNKELEYLRERWSAVYNRALAGETFKTSSAVDDLMFEYSLSPIIENGDVIGASIIGEDISARIRQEREMAAVNKQLAELRLMALRSVMNPHFVFNCLNSIQFYIMENDRLNAVKYLSTFSRLIRSILNNSVNSRVRLSEELEVLKNYIDLESIRFENKFTASINVDPEIDIDSVEIPSMLIQPYVENAILHGLGPLKEAGQLDISVRREQDMILIAIQDNGIGRAAAAKRKSEFSRTHRSMGTKLTEERLSLINENGSASVEINDMEHDGKACGTRVNVWIKDNTINV